MLYRGRCRELPVVESRPEAYFSSIASEPTTRLSVAAAELALFPEWTCDGERWGSRQPNCHGIRAAPTAQFAMDQHSARRLRDRRGRGLACLLGSTLPIRRAWRVPGCSRLVGCGCRLALSTSVTRRAQCNDGREAPARVSALSPIVSQVTRCAQTFPRAPRRAAARQGCRRRHSDLKTTELYLHSSPEVAKLSVDMLAKSRALGGVPSSASRAPLAGSSREGSSSPASPRRR